MNDENATAVNRRKYLIFLPTLIFCSTAFGVMAGMISNPSGIVPGGIAGFVVAILWYACMVRFATGPVEHELVPVGALIGAFMGLLATVALHVAVFIRVEDDIYLTVALVIGIPIGLVSGGILGAVYGALFEVKRIATDTSRPSGLADYLPISWPVIVLFTSIGAVGGLVFTLYGFISGIFIGLVSGNIWYAVMCRRARRPVRPRFALAGMLLGAILAVVSIFVANSVIMIPHGDYRSLIPMLKYGMPAGLIAGGAFGLFLGRCFQREYDRGRQSIETDQSVQP